MNAYFKHAGGAGVPRAPRHERVVGRISAQIDRAYDDQHGPGTGMFGFFEFEDDAEVARALLDAARGWLSERGRSRMIGPMDYTMNDECGVLIEGFEREPMIKQPWHPPYYQQRIEEAGLEKAIDLYMWALDISDREKILPVIFELAEQARSKHGVHAAPPAPPRPVQEHQGRLRRGLQHCLEAQLGLRAVLRRRPQALRRGAAARL